MQIGDLSKARTLCERRDNAALQAVRVLLVIGLMAGGSLALWLAGGSSPSAEGMVTAAPPETVETPARVQVAGAEPTAFMPAPKVAAPIMDPPAASPKGNEREPGPDNSIPQASDQTSAALKQAEAAPDRPASPVPAAPTDMDMTGAVTQQASLVPRATSENSVADLIDLNKASIEELNSLKGTGALGRAIVKGRPYKSVDDLVKKKILRRTVYEKIKDQVTVQ